MYNFVDTIETSEGFTLPSEALQINGEYIENLISGYRTLHVEGREALSPDVVSYSTGIRDGSWLKNKRYPERVITVTYQLIAKSNEEFRESYNKLGGILNVEDAELIFNDEQDKFFIGTPCTIGAVDPGLNSVIGEFEILCTDPFKYSVTEYEAKPDPEESSVFVDYNGTYKAFPTLEASFFSEEESSEDGETITELTGNGDCGFVAFFNDNEKIIQLGDPDETDGDSAAFPKSQTLVNSTFKTTSAWGSAAKSQWKVNSGLTSSASVEQAGSFEMGVASYAGRGTSTSTKTQHLLHTWSHEGAPTVFYDVYVSTSNRTANSVKVKVVIESKLKNKDNLLGNGYEVTASIGIRGAHKNIVLKENMGDRWVGGKTYTASATLTVNGLTETTTSLNTVFFYVHTNSEYKTGEVPSTTCPNITISPYTIIYDVPDTYYLSPASYGSGSNWHGPSITRVIPADQNGDVGAVNFTLSYAQKLSIGSSKNDTKQKGQCQVMLTSGSGSSRRVIAGVNVYKPTGSGKTATLRIYVNGKHYDQEVDVSYNNKYFKPENTTTITKSGQTLTFNVCGIQKTYRDSALANVAVNEITFTLAKFGDAPALSYNGLFWIKFVKNNCETWKEVPNKFSANDVVAADCKTGEILLNGVSTPALGALGNDWEGFFLTPGFNQIGIAYSDWVTAECAPTFKVKYREVFL